jgi:hypothetical protein
VASNGTSSTIVASAYGETLIAQNTAAAALTTLGLTATAAELNVLDGITASTAEINLLDGVTSTTAELNILDGVTATAAELNVLDGITSTTAELNVLDGIAGIASQAEAEAGTISTKLMTPQRVLQSITANSTVLLSTLTTVTGNTYTTPTLDLTPYKFVTAIVDGVGDNSATSGNFSIFGLALVATGTTSTNRIYGSWTLDLQTGLFFGMSQVVIPTAFPQVFAVPVSTGGRTALSNATTTFTVSMAITTFAAGTVRFYGIR